MKCVTLGYEHGFRILIGDEHSQAAEMVVAPGAKVGGPENRHRGADQWLYVAGEAGVAVSNGHSYSLEPGSLLLIQRGDGHEIRNTGTADLKTLNIYVPPAYDAKGDMLPAGKA